MVNDSVPDNCGADESFTVMVAVPTALGVPLRTPVAVLNDIPAGRPDIERIYGRVPPVAPIVVVGYSALMTPFGRDAGVTTSGGTTVRVRVTTRGVGAVESVTVTVPLPAAVGVPLNTPVAELNDIPAGRPEADST